MHTACRLVQAIYRVTSFLLSLWRADTDWGGLCSLQIKLIVLLSKDDPKLWPNGPWFERPKRYVINPRFSCLNWRSYVCCLVRLTRLKAEWKAELLCTQSGQFNNSISPIWRQKSSFIWWNIPVFESFILDYKQLFTIGQQQKYTADCIVLVEYCEKQFCVR